MLPGRTAAITLAQTSGTLRWVTVCGAAVALSKGETILCAGGAPVCSELLGKRVPYTSFH